LSEDRRSLPTLGPEVALPWLWRLRWVAVSGQTLTLLFAALALEVELPYVALGGVIAITVVTNLALTWVVRDHRDWGGLVPGVLCLDILLLTALLYLSGGPKNPFSFLYVVHVAMAAVTLSLPWTSLMVGLSAACYGLLFAAHVPLKVEQEEIGFPLYQAGTWFSVSLVAALVAFYTGRVTGALRSRDRQLAQAREVALRNERLASLTTLAAGAAHELGTPLGTIAVVAKELELAADGIEQPELAEDARLIRSQVDRCREILDRMSASTLTQGGPATGPVPLAELAESLQQAIGPTPLRVEPGGLEAIVAPRAELLQALLPLVQNARDASEGAGPVHLQAQAVEGWIEVRVRDEGAGMSDAVLARAGEPFYTTKEPGQGTGLGLHVARLLAEQLGGDVQLASEVGRGTTATLRFPQGEAVT